MNSVETPDSFTAFCDGLDAAGMHEYARRGRSIAADLRTAWEELAAERSARRALQARIDTLEATIARLHAERPVSGDDVVFGEQ